MASPDPVLDTNATRFHGPSQRALVFGTIMQPTIIGFAMVNASGNKPKERTMADSVYKVIEIIGTSKDSWERAATVAIERATKSLRDLRVAEVVLQDLVIEDGKVEAFRTKLRLSFKFEA